MASAQQYRLSDGPGKFDLMIALFDDEPRTVRFSFQQVPYESPPGHTQFPDGITYGAEVDVWSAQRHFNPGDEWIIGGRVKRSNLGPIEGDRFTIGFTTRYRKGSITFEELTPIEQCA